jgi:putative ABC transport system permease protein
MPMTRTAKSGQPERGRTVTTPPTRTVVDPMPVEENFGPSTIPSGHRPRRRGIDRFLFTYVYREFRTRFWQALLIALGLGCGVGLVVTVSAVSAGVGNAQGAILHSLYGIGTDLTVTHRTAGAANTPTGGGQGAIPDTLQPGTFRLLADSWVTRISRLANVASAAGGLELTEFTQGAGVPVSISVDGVDLAHPDLGPLASGTMISGHGFVGGDELSNVAIVDSNYSTTNRLKVGSALTIANATVRVIGIVRQAQAGTSDIYLPLARAQALAQSTPGKSLTGQVSEIYVAVASSNVVPAVQSDIARLSPALAVTSASDLASQVSGSLASTAKLTSDLGKWVASGALLAAFAITGLLTAAAVNRRTKELGTLRALGWSTRRVVMQIMSESLVIGLLGALIGIALGFSGSAFVHAVTPTLSAYASRSAGFGGGSTIPVHLVPTLRVAVVIIAVLLALLGSLVAGSVGAWRASRLQPVDAFAEIG